MYPTSGDYCGYLCSLFDWGFHSFVTPKVIRVLYILAVILFLISAILMIIGGFQMSVARGIITLIIIGPLYFLVSVTITRIVLEIVMVVFRIGENVAKLAGETGLRPLAEPAPAMGGTPPPAAPGAVSGPSTTPPPASGTTQPPPPNPPAPPAT